MLFNLVEGFPSSSKFLKMTKLLQVGQSPLAVILAPIASCGHFLTLVCCPLSPCSSYVHHEGCNNLSRNPVGNRELRGIHVAELLRTPWPWEFSPCPRPSLVLSLSLHWVLSNSRSSLPEPRSLPFTILDHSFYPSSVTVPILPCFSPWTSCYLNSWLHLLTY